MKTLLATLLLFLSFSVCANEDTIRELETAQLQEMVDHCDQSAIDGTLAYGDIMFCSIAYDELVHGRYGSYKAYIERE